VNRATLPALEGEVDDVLGCVCRLDQCLLFKPWSHHARVQAAKRALADNASRAGDLKSKELKSDDSYRYLSGKEYEIKSGDDIHYDESTYGKEDGLGDLVI
jgi:hypothetical protein